MIRKHKKNKSFEEEKRERNFFFLCAQNCGMPIAFLFLFPQIYVERGGPAPFRPCLLQEAAAACVHHLPAPFFGNGNEKRESEREREGVAGGRCGQCGPSSSSILNSKRLQTSRNEILVGRNYRFHWTFSQEKQARMDRKKEKKVRANGRGCCPFFLLHLWRGNVGTCCWLACLPAWL